MSDTVDGRSIYQLKVVELKTELDKRGLSKSGKKDELVARLASFLEAQSEENKETSANAEEEPTEERTGGEEVDKEIEEKTAREEEERREAEQQKIEEKRRAEEHERLEAEEEKRRAEKRERDRREAEKKEKEEEEKIEKERAEKLRLEEAERKREEEEDMKKKEEKEKKRLEKERKRREENEEDSKQIEKDDNASDGDQLKKEIEEEILREERRLKREDERREKARKAKEDTEKTTEGGEENHHQEEENEADENNKKVKHKRIEWPKSPAKQEEQGEVSEKKADKLDKEDLEDTLVMEIDQSDMVVEEPMKEEKEEGLPEAEPGQVTSLRKLGSKGNHTGGDGERRKRGWGSRGVSRLNSSENIDISSKDLKDIVPDIKPLLSTDVPLDEGEEQKKEPEKKVEEEREEGPALPEEKREEDIPRKKRKRIEDATETAVIQIINLTRPFTVNQLKEMLKRTGTIEDFWIDRIKSKCVVHFANVDQASETRMALDGVKWPVSNPKTLQVNFSSEEALKKLKESEESGRGAGVGDLSGRVGGMREWDRNKVNQEAEKREREVEKRERDRRDKRERSKEKSPERKPNKTLEELFRKTTTTPSIYWIPLSEEQIRDKEEARNRKVMEADLLRVTMSKMMDEKDGRNKRLATGRRRSSSRSNTD